MTMVDKKNLTRFPILNLKEELTACRIAKGRHSEYIKLFESHLNDTEYYCLSPYNPVRPKNAHWLLGKESRIYLAGGYSNFFVATTCEVEGYKTKAIVQKIYPKTAWEFHHQDDNCVVYVSKKDIDRYLESIDN